MSDRPSSRKRKVSSTNSPQSALSRSSSSEPDEESRTDKRKVARLSHLSEQTIIETGVSSPNLAKTKNVKCEKCPICLKVITYQVSAVTDTCSYHTFCLKCLEEWSKIKKTCPVDRKEYSSILVLDSSGRVSTQLPIKWTVSNILHTNAESILCEACGLFIDSEFTLICDNCEAIFHSYCVTFPLENFPNPWLCDDCWCFFNDY